MIKQTIECPEIHFAGGQVKWYEDKLKNNGDDVKHAIYGLKILPEYFEAAISGRKNFELRRNDRDYKEGDVIILREWDEDQEYTGRSFAVGIKYVLKNCPEYGLQDGYCIFCW